MEPALVTALAVVIPAIAASTIAPAILVWMNMRAATRNRAEEAEIRRREKEDDYRRQDEVAKRLVESNRMVASQVARSEQLINVKLDEVHVLVNSAYTAALQSALEAVQAKLVVLLDSAAFKKEHRIKLSSDAMADIEATKIKMNELSTAISERMRQDALVKEEKARLVLAGVQPRQVTSGQPLPVADERTAVASERSAAAAERSADATSRVADAAEDMKKK